MTARYMSFTVKALGAELGRVSLTHRLDKACLILALVTGTKKQRPRTTIIVAIMAIATGYWRQWHLLPWIFLVNFRMCRYSLKGALFHVPGFIKWELVATIWKSI